MVNAMSSGPEFEIRLSGPLNRNHHCYYADFALIRDTTPFFCMNPSQVILGNFHYNKSLMLKSIHWTSLPEC